MSAAQKLILLFQSLPGSAPHFASSTFSQAWGAASRPFLRASPFWGSEKAPKTFPKWPLFASSRLQGLASISAHTYRTDRCSLTSSIYSFLSSELLELSLRCRYIHFNHNIQFRFFIQKEPTKFSSSREKSRFYLSIPLIDACDIISYNTPHKGLK